MTARYGIIDLEDDPEIPTFNFEAVSLPPALTMGTTGQSIRPRSSSKLNARSVTSLQVLSPRARAANAIGSPQQLPQPAAQTAARDKGKGRARPIDIIELSDSDSDEAPVASTSRSAIGLSRPTPSAGWPPASSTRTPARDVEVTATSVPKRNTPPNDVPTLPVAPEATVEPVVAEQPRVEEELHVAEASNVNHLDQLIASVLEIVPDVDPDHVKTMFTVNNPDGSIERATELLQPILHSLFESGNYPKKVEAKRKRQEDPDAPVAGPSQPKKRRVETVVRMNIASRNRPRIYSANYSDLCMVRPIMGHCYKSTDYLKVLAWGQVSLPAQGIFNKEVCLKQLSLRSDFCTHNETHIGWGHTSNTTQEAANQSRLFEPTND